MASVSEPRVTKFAVGLLHIMWTHPLPRVGKNEDPPDIARGSMVRYIVAEDTFGWLSMGWITVFALVARQ